MNERWKYQIKSGLPFGLLLPIGLGLVDCYGTSFSEAFFTLKFLITLLIFLFLGIFVIGFNNWKERRKTIEYNK
jgi:cytochrome c biogenesis factor